MANLLLALFVVLPLLGLARDSQAASAPAKSIIAHAAVNARVLPVWVAREQGFFSKYGVPAETIFIRQAPSGFINEMYAQYGVK